MNQRSPWLNRLAIVPIPLLALAMVALWVADVRVVWPLPPLTWLVHYGSVALGVAFIVIPAARSFLANGQPSVLMLGCGMLMMDVGVTAMPIGFARSSDTALRDLQHVHLVGGPVPFCRRGRHLPAQDPSEAFRHVADGCLCGRRGGDGAGHLGRLYRSDAGLLHRGPGRDPAAQPGGERSRGALRPDGGPSLADEPPHAVAIPLLVCAGSGSAGSRSGRVHGDCREGLSLAVGHAVHADLWDGLYVRGGAGLGARRPCQGNSAGGSRGSLAGERVPGEPPAADALGWVLRYGLAVVAVAAALGLRLALTAWVGPGLPTYITFYPAVMVVALLAGFGPGLVATALAGLVAAYWILPPVGQFAIASPVDRLGLVIFFGMGLFMSVVAELYRRNRDKAAAYDREAALRESQARLATFAEATFEGIVESEAGRIVDCNEQFARMLGYSVAELRGMEIASLIAPEDRDRVMASIRQGQESVTEHAVLRKDGTRIVVEAHGRPVSPGSVRRHTAIRDITDRKRAEERIRQAKEEMEQTFNTVPDFVAILDDQHRIVRANRSDGRAIGRHDRPMHRITLLRSGPRDRAAARVLSPCGNLPGRSGTYRRGPWSRAWTETSSSARLPG